MCSVSKEQSILARETIQNAFFCLLELCPFSTWTFYPLSNTQQANVGTCIRTLLHYGSFSFTSVVGSENRTSSRGIFVT